MGKRARWATAGIGAVTLLLGACSPSSGVPAAVINKASRSAACRLPPCGPSVVADPPISPRLRPGDSVAALLHSDEPPRSRDGVFGLLLLQRGDVRNQGVCRAFFRRLEAVADPMAPSFVARNYAGQMRWEMVTARPTFWPVRKPTKSEPDLASEERTTCGTLLQRYDWSRAGVELSRVGLAAVNGPVLVGIGPQAEGQNDLPMVVLDLSRTPDSELPRAFRIWRGIITANATSWPPMQTYIGFREEIRNALIANAATITSLLMPKAVADQAKLEPTIGRPPAIPVVEDDPVIFKSQPAGPSAR